MSIWYYGARHQQNNDAILASQSNCIFCNTPLYRDKEDEKKATLSKDVFYGWSDNFTTNSSALLGICPACGWWKYVLETQFGGKGVPSITTKIGSLKKLDLADISLPLQEVRAYLVARYEARFETHPRLFEEVVASVFRDHGFEADVTAYSGDGGIDVNLRGDEQGSIGVQVKRYKGRISVGQIRELTGALVINGHTKGIFVTTSEFESGANKTAAMSSDRGYPVELVDGHAFLDALKIAQLSSTKDLHLRKPWGEVDEWYSLNP